MSFNARYGRLVVTKNKGGGDCRLAELQLLQAGSGINLFAAATFSDPGGAPSTYPVTALNDGDTTAAGGTGFWLTSFIGPAIAYFDLGSSQDVALATLRMFPRDDSSEANAPANFSLEFTPYGGSGFKSLINQVGTGAWFYGSGNHGHSQDFALAAAPATALILSGATQGNQGDRSGPINISANGPLPSSLVQIALTASVTTALFGDRSNLQITTAAISSDNPIATIFVKPYVAGTFNITIDNAVGLADPAALVYTALNGAIVPKKKLRVCSTYNKMPRGVTLTTGIANYTVDYHSFKTIAGGAVDSFVLSFDRFYRNGLDSLPAKNVSLRASIYNTAGTQVSVPITFAGQRDLGLASGDFDRQCDPFTPAMFGLSSFPAGTRFGIKIRVTAPLIGTDILDSGMPTATWSTAQSNNFDPTATTGSTVDAVGPFTYTGTAPSVNTFVYQPHMLGYFSSGDPITLVGVVDSIIATGGPVEAGPDAGGPYLDINPNGGGWFLRGAQNAAGGPIPTLNLSQDGNNLFGVMVSQPGYTDHYISAGYANTLVDESGTNDMNPGEADPHEQNVRWLVNLFRKAGGVYVIRTSVTPRTSGDFTSVSGQSYQTSYSSPGGAFDTFNTWVASNPGNIFDYLLPFASVRAAGNALKWAANSTQDGTHPNSAAHGLMATDFVAVLNALPPIGVSAAPKFGLRAGSVAVLSTGQAVPLI